MFEKMLNNPVKTTADNTTVVLNDSSNKSNSYKFSFIEQLVLDREA